MKTANRESLVQQMWKLVLGAYRGGQLEERLRPLADEKRIMKDVNHAKALLKSTLPKLLSRGEESQRLFQTEMNYLLLSLHDLAFQIGVLHEARAEQSVGGVRLADSEGLRKRLIRLAHANPELRAEILPLVVASKADWVKVFDGLRSGQTIKASFKAVMGSSDLLDGSLHEFKVGRKSVSKKHGVESVALEPVGRPKMGPGARIRLHKRTKADGTAMVTASTGDMGMSIVDLKV